MSTAAFVQLPLGVPYVRGSDTSYAAAREGRKKLLTDEAKVLAFITSRGTTGATDDEIEVALGLLHQNASARRRQLEKDGLVVHTSQRRPTRHGRQAGVYCRSTKP